MSSLYVHIPFRGVESSYREEYYVVREGPYTAFLDALLIELEMYAARYAGEEAVETIYIGGGEPSLLSPEELNRMLERMRALFTVESAPEITVEANPHDLSRTYLQQLRALGVNRVSLAIQSFLQQDITRLGCRQSPEEAKAALLLLPQTGLTNFSVDLIFGIPDQPLEYWQANLERVVRHGTPHVSTYRAGSSQDHDNRETPSAEETNRRYQFAIDYLREQGYQHYELSHFARPGCESRHLQGYWCHDNYIGFGPSAHSFWWTRQTPAVRWSNTSNIAKYCDLLQQRELPLEARERISPITLANEYIMLRLQTSDGLDLDILRKRYAADLTTSKRSELRDLESEKWIKWMESNRIRLTDEGKFRYEPITSRLLLSNDDLLTS